MGIIDRVSVESIERATAVRVLAAVMRSAGLTEIRVSLDELDNIQVGIMSVHDDVATGDRVFRLRPAQACGAMRPAAVEKQTWICDGNDLVIVCPASRTLPPSVIRRDLIPYLSDADRKAMREQRSGEAFSGGDHMHITLSVPLFRPVGP